MSMPVYNGANNADDPLVTPWNISGWTAQAIPQDTVQVAPNSFAPVPFPASIVFAQLQAPYFDFDGNPLSGFLSFMMNDNINITYNNATYRLPARLAGRDNTNFPGGMNNWGTGRIYIRKGFMSCTIMCSTQTGLTTDTGNPLTYHVVEHFMGGQQYDIAVPSSTVSPADLRSLIVSGSIAPYYYDPKNPMGNEGYVPFVPAPSTLTGIDGGGA